MEVVRVEALHLRFWRNIKELTWRPGSHFNVIAGDNGAGKTSVLEAVDYLSTCSTFRGGRSVDLVTQEEPRALLAARMVDGPLTRELRVKLESGPGRVLSLDGKRPRSIALWRQVAPRVVFHPSELRLASGPPEERRRYLDAMLEVSDMRFATALSHYQKALRSRNRLLKQSPDAISAIRAFDSVLATAGAIIGQSRIALCDDIARVAAPVFAQLFGEQLSLGVHYEPRVFPEQEKIRKALFESLRKDQQRGYTVDGPHSDELQLSIASRAARRQASQGQQRGIALALKIAEIQVLKARTRRVPIVLLDDVTSELDRGRNARLFELLSDLGGQVFLSTTHAEYIHLTKNRQDITMIGGSLSP